MKTNDVDVAVIGAGSAGAAVALGCARQGLGVVVCEQRPLDTAGARWINAVPSWTFRRAGIAPPSGNERVGNGGTVHLVAGEGRLTITCPGLLEVDMRALIARLQREARAAGATFRSGCKVLGWDGRRLQIDGGTSLAPRWLVDASGACGINLLGAPPASDLCSAAQQVNRVRDDQAAASFFAELGVQPGQAYSVVGFEGGFSTLGMRWQDDRIGILTGTIPALGYPTGPELLERFVTEHPWIGERLFGGAGTIPLGRPADRPGQGRLAAVGDAAGQVFTAHGSGVGQGLIAADLLARALADGGGPEGYALAYQRRYGGILAAFDAFRRLSQSLTPPELTRLVEVGVLSAETAWFGLSQGERLPSPAALARACRGALANPVLGARLTGALARMGALLVLYRGYPRRIDRLARWSHLVDRVDESHPA